VAGLVTGIIATTILDSSSLTIILVIALVHAGAMSFHNSLAVVLGSNVGTTVSSQVFAFGADRYAAVILVAGLILMYRRRGERGEDYGHVLFSMGLVFYGLHQVGSTMEPLSQNGAVERWLHGLENPVAGMLAGAGATAAIQSSSAMMGIVIKLAAVLGAEIGTCLDTLLAAAGRSREALRTGIFHLAFNVITVAPGLLFYQQIAAVGQWLPSGGHVERQIANSHIFFNFAGALLFLPLVSLCARGLQMAVPDGFSAKEREQPEMA
jgi:phosphate:Na+ symporter